jgi:hypothetical protein
MAEIKMLVRADLKPWIVDALQAHDGRASVLEVCKYVWDHHQDDLRRGGDLFYTWQYDIRWAATKLRQEKILSSTEPKSSAPWRLSERTNA